MPDSPVKKLLQDETQKHALIGHLPREVAVMYREALAEIDRLEKPAAALAAIAKAVTSIDETLVLILNKLPNAND